MKDDEAIDRLLEQAMRARDARPAGICLDAETVAGWADGSLTAAERRAAEAHAADCDRCLALLAAMAKTAPPPTVAQRPPWLSVRWLVPLTTAAVAITAWVVIQERPEPRPAATAPAAPVVDAIAPPEQPPVAEQAQASKRRETREADVPPARTAPPARKPGPPQPAPVPPAAAAPRAQAVPELKDERAETFAAMSKAVPPRVISSPDPDVRWRLAGASVERSTDGGRTWQPQSPGTTAELMAGASPAPTVCWIVGRHGTVLRTTDGLTWRRLAFPSATADLVGVAATDAASATVTTADGRTYRTSDGGRTWVLQENPAAPF
jgi:hypothetical protein